MKSNRSSADAMPAALYDNMLVGDDFLLAIATADLGLKYQRGIYISPQLLRDPFFNYYAISLTQSTGFDVADSAYRANLSAMPPTAYATSNRSITLIQL